MKKYLMILGLAAVAAAPVAFAGAKCTPAQICKPSLSDLTDGTPYTISGLVGPGTSAHIVLPKGLPHGNAECNVYTPSNPGTSITKLKWTIFSGKNSEGKYDAISTTAGVNSPLVTDAFVYGADDSIYLAPQESSASNLRGPRPDPFYFSVWCQSK